MSSATASHELDRRARVAFHRPREIDYYRQLGDPGEFPYTRGTRAPRPEDPTRPDGGTIVRELSGEGPASRSNEQFRYLLDHGATGLDVIGDGPTVAMMDPDHPHARHAVGNTGVSLCRADDFRALYADLPLDRVSVSHSLPCGVAVAGIYLGAIANGFDPALLRGSTILGPLYGQDTGYSTNVPVELYMRLATDSIIFAAERMPRFHAFVEDTYYISDGGIDIVDEMALGFIEIREVVRRLTAQGIPVDSYAPRIALLVNCRMDFFEEIAKIRATRRYYARMMRDEFGARDPRSLAINVAAHTSGATMTSAQLVNNVVRGTSQTLALHIAGVRAMEISAFDEAIRTPSEEAHLVGLRTQQIVQLETGVSDVVDPLGGSYYVEALTDDLERRIEGRVHALEGLGDVLDLSSAGVFRAIFTEGLIDRAREVNDGSRAVVGVNCHQMLPQEDVLLRDIAERRIDPYYGVIEDVRQWRAQRDHAGVVAALHRLEAIGRDRAHGNVVVGLIEALQADASIGEAIGALRESYGLPYDPLRGARRPT